MQRLTVLLLAFIAPLAAEQGVLVVRVKDIHQHAMKGLQLRVEGSAVGAPTDDSGLARIRLSPQTKQGSWVAVQLVKSQTDLVFISPWDGQVMVPPFESATEVPVVLATRGDRAVLENGAALSSITASVLKKIQPLAKNAPASGEQQSSEALAEVSRTYGLKPEDLDKAIRAWGDNTEDPYEKGLVALYEKRYPEATSQLQVSLTVREGELSNARDKVADAAFYLGQSLYEQGKYRVSAAAFEKTANLRPDDVTTMNDLGASFYQAGDYARAEPLFRRALAIRGKALGPDHPGTATSLNNLALLLKAKGDYAGAELLVRRALAICEKALGPVHPTTQTVRKNLDGFLNVIGR
jgi:tetratricopeptide (TPR) repeat protein